MHARPIADPLTPAFSKKRYVTTSQTLMSVCGQSRGREITCTTLQTRMSVCGQSRGRETTFITWRMGYVTHACVLLSRPLLDQDVLHVDTIQYRGANLVCLVMYISLLWMLARVLLHVIDAIFGTLALVCNTAILSVHMMLDFILEFVQLTCVVVLFSFPILEGVWGAFRWGNILNSHCKTP